MQVTLTYTDAATGRTRGVNVAANRFTIGRSPDNDLPLNDSNLSRRHAVIEISGDSIHISDCGSQNGTTVNAHPVTTATALRDGDRIMLGGVYELSVSLRSDFAAADVYAFDEAASSPPSSPAPAIPAQTTNASPSSMRPPVIAAAAIAAILVVAGGLLALTMFGGAEDRAIGSETRGDGNAARIVVGSTGASPAAPARRDAPDEATSARAAGVASSATSSQPATTGADSTEQIGRAARRAMSRISNDNSPYISEAGIKEVAEQVGKYRGSSALAARLNQMARGCGELTALAQGSNLKPSLVTFAALAQAEIESGDPLAVARRMMPKLLTLRATFGTETANSSLLLVAAYPYPFNPPIGSQTRTPHPLASKLMQFGGKRSTVDVSVARSVWFLREQDGIMPEAYNLVVRLLAIGIIAQDPQRYGVDAAPLLC